MVRRRRDGRRRNCRGIVVEAVETRIVCGVVESARLSSSDCGDVVELKMFLRVKRAIL